MVDVDDKALAASLLPVVNPVEGAHLAGGDAELGQAWEQVGERDVGEGGVDDCDDRVAVLDALAVRREPGASASSPKPAASLRQRASLPQASWIIPSEQAKRPYGQIDGRWLPLAWTCPAGGTGRLEVGLAAIDAGRRPTGRCQAG